MKMKPEMIFRYGLTGLQMAAWLVFGVSFAIAFVFLLTPCLLPILTVGSCLFYGKEEFFEYAITSFYMALAPLMIGGISGICAYGLRQGSRRMNEKAKQEEVEQLNLARIANLNKQGARRSA